MLGGEKTLKLLLGKQENILHAEAHRLQKNEIMIKYITPPFFFFIQSMQWKIVNLEKNKHFVLEAHSFIWG